MQLVIVCLLTFFVSISVNSESPKEVTFNEGFQLRFDETAHVPSQQLTIQFKSLLEDSRCPKGDQCITAGNASIELQLTRDKEEPVTVQLNTDSDPKEADYQKYKIKLISLSPYPVSGRQTEASQYTATLMIVPV